jgi:hypothetical protein
VVGLWCSALAADPGLVNWMSTSRKGRNERQGFLCELSELGVRQMHLCRVAPGSTASALSDRNDGAVKFFVSLFTSAYIRVIRGKNDREMNDD